MTNKTSKTNKTTTTNKGKTTMNTNVTGGELLAKETAKENEEQAKLEAAKKKAAADKKAAAAAKKKADEAAAKKAQKEAQAAAKKAADDAEKAQLDASIKAVKEGAETWSETLTKSLTQAGTYGRQFSNDLFDFVKANAQIANKAGKKAWADGTKDLRDELNLLASKYEVGTGQIKQAFGLLANCSGKFSLERRTDALELIAIASNLNEVVKGMTERQQARDELAKTDGTNGVDDPRQEAETPEAPKLSDLEALQAKVAEAMTLANSIGDETLINIMSAASQQIAMHLAK